MPSRYLLAHADDAGADAGEERRPLHGGLRRGSKRIHQGMCGRAPDPAKGMMSAQHSTTIDLVGFVKQ